MLANPDVIQMWDKEFTPLHVSACHHGRETNSHKGSSCLSRIFLSTSEHSVRSLTYQKRYESLLVALRKGYEVSEDERNPLEHFPGARTVLESGRTSSSVHI